MKASQNRLWQTHAEEWRHPSSVINHSKVFGDVDEKLLAYKTFGPWWDILSRAKLRLIVSREYEHLLICLGASQKKEEVSYCCLPHPSGVAVDHQNKKVFIASTRNPNQIFEFRNSAGLIARGDLKRFSKTSDASARLLPSRNTFFPGSLYIHDLAFIGRKLYANAVGHNAVVEIKENGDYVYAWWPKCVQDNGKPNIKANFLQLNSIAAGVTIKDSFFTASGDCIQKSRPGDMDFPVDQRGVVFSGRSREPVCKGLTRPHSARKHKGKIWLDNSGYGQLGFIHNEKFCVVATLPGWTRGLCFHNHIAFVGVSRVIPKFYHYAPGLDVKKSRCGVYAVDITNGQILAGLEWANGNQIFSVETIPQSFSEGFLYDYKPKQSHDHDKHFYYAFKM